MPYIADSKPFSKRDQLSYNPWDADTSAELNYVFSKMIIWYINNKGLSYQTLNDIAGALGLAQREFQRRIVDQYEARKVVENGDIGYADIR